MIYLEYLLKINCIRQKELAEELGIKPQNLTLWLKEKQNISKKYLPVLAKRFGVKEEDLQKNIKIETSDDFRHFVVYKNIGDNFICVEPQTCSINAHRLNADGFKYANVINILPNQIKRGSVNIVVNQN